MLAGNGIDTTWWHILHMISEAVECLPSLPTAVVKVDRNCYYSHRNDTSLRVIISCSDSALVLSAHIALMKLQQPQGILTSAALSITKNEEV